MKSSRREFIQQSAVISGATLLGGPAGLERAFGEPGSKRHPNILLLMVDQQRMPPAYGPGEGMAQGLKEILGFEALSPDNPYTRFFPGFMRLRQNAVVLRTHYTASSACVPSRTCIMTGSYTTGVNETDGMLKTAEDVTWLDPEGTPTIGHWFRAAGYSTHYFGKWHVSYPEVQGLEPDNSLEPWGFADWESSCPEPHGGGASNLGVYRDIGFAQNVVEFLTNKATDPSQTPWLAVGSLVNPHDLGYIPEPWALPGDQGVVDWVGWPPPQRIPVQGELSNQLELPPKGSGTFTDIVDLNPDGFPQETFNLPPTIYEQLNTNNKPRCQYDYSLKFGLMAKAIQENDIAGQVAGFVSPHPYQFRDDADDWYLAYGQFYMYCMYLAEMRLREMLKALDDTPGLAENTIVVFLSDHGELAGAHGGMIQKWHNAYEESIHVPMVVSSPLVNRDALKMKEIIQPTSSIDVAPTLLGLAGYEPKMLLGKMQDIHGKAKVRAFVGTDLSPHIKGDGAGQIYGPDGNPRKGVFFMTYDTITELGPNGDKNDYDRFIGNVDTAIGKEYPLEPGTVTQPNHVHAFCAGDWKIVRYFDPSGAQPDEWELYCLASDPIEAINLVDFSTGEVRDDVGVPGLNKNQLRSINKQLRKELARHEVLMLG